MRRHGSASISRHEWPPPTVSSASSTTPGFRMKCCLARVWKSKVPLSVITSWRTGAVCQSSVPPDAVCLE